MTLSLVYVTAATRADALAIARRVVDERLAACANILDGMISVYRWEGGIQEDAEVVLILKTRAELVPALTERIIALHPYTLPCVLALPIGGGNPAFLTWIAGETRSSA